MLKTGDAQAHETASWPRIRVLPLRSLFNRQYWWATLVVLLGLWMMTRSTHLMSLAAEEASYSTARSPPDRSAAVLPVSHEALVGESLCQLPNRPSMVHVNMGRDDIG